MRPRPDVWRRLESASGGRASMTRTLSGTLEMLLPCFRANLRYSVVQEPTKAELEKAQQAVAARNRFGPNTPLHDDAQRTLEQLASLIERPALIVENGTFPVPDSRWRLLAEHKASLERVVAAVGRIEVARPGGPQRQVGTGFVVGPSIIMTNAHVAAALLKSSDTGGRRELQTGLGPRIDFSEERGSQTPREHEITGVLYLSERDDVDCALLAIAEVSSSGGPPPDPLPLARRNRLGEGDLVCAVGYPRRSEDRVDLETPGLLDAVMAGVYDVKRVMPGEVMATGGTTFTHDCSTMRGSSGSVVVRVDSTRAGGLHFDGAPREGNYAFNLQRLVKLEPRLAQLLVASDA